MPIQSPGAPGVERLEGGCVVQPLFGVFFTVIGLSMIRGFRRLRGHLHLVGRVVEIDESRINHYFAVIDVPGHGRTTAPYEDAGFYRVGQDVKCMWDGASEVSVSVDDRASLLIGGCLMTVVGLFLLAQHLLGLG